MLEAFARVARFTVPFSDVDMNRHVNNVAYLRWAEQGRVDYVREILGEAIAGRRGIILRKTEIVYDRPLVLDERVAFGTRIARIGTTSMAFVSDCCSEDAEALCARATCTVVAFDYGAGTSRAIPEEWIRRIVAHESVAPDRSASARRAP